MTRAQFLAMAAVCLLSGCGLLAGDAQQKTQDALLHAVSRAATAVLSEQGYRPDIEGAICIAADDVAEEAFSIDIPLAMCLVPGLEVPE